LYWDLDSPHAPSVLSPLFKKRGAKAACGLRGELLIKYALYSFNYSKVYLSIFDKTFS